MILLAVPSESRERERMSIMAGMVTIGFTLMMGRGTSSIAAKARTATLLKRSIMWTAVARRRCSHQ